MFDKKIYDNGLTLITQTLENTKAVTCLVLVGAGSRYETKDINGIAHFLEHMFFKGAKKFKNTKEVSEAIDSVGGDFNAFTGKEYAGYYVKVTSDHVDVAADVLSDMLIHATCDPHEIEKERGVILEEYNMYQDTPMYQIGWNFERIIFGNQPMGWDQIGTKELITTVTQDQFIDYKNTLYTPDNTVIVFAGNITAEKADELTKKYFTFNDAKRTRDFKALEKLETPRSIIENKKTEQGHIVVGVKAYPLTHDDYYAAKILAVLLGGNMSSRMFLNVREAKGLSYYISTSCEGYSDAGILSTRAGVDVTRTKLAISAILEEYRKARDEEISEQELIKSKEYLKGKIVLKLEDSEEFAHMLAKQELLLRDTKTPEEVHIEIDKVTVEDLKRVAADIFKEENLKLAMIGPFEEKESYESLLTFDSKVAA